jgi:hypothetical protein
MTFINVVFTILVSPVGFYVSDAGLIVWFVDFRETLSTSHLAQFSRLSQEAKQAVTAIFMIFFRIQNLWDFDLPPP